MHLPTSELGSVIKLAPASIPRLFRLQVLPCSLHPLIHPAAKKKKKKKIPRSFSFRLRFGAPRTRFGAVKPPLPCALPFLPA
ncbi:hypothetical protein TNCV_4537961 [Trichonephila clavipes]|nr:hypothetical protein TNCV_4537961 [Trichonephila clavipes]